MHLVIAVYRVGVAVSRSRSKNETAPGGIDVRAVLRVHRLTAVPTVVQAMRWTNNVPGGVVRELRGALVVGEQGIVITTGDFTKGAVKEATLPERRQLAW